MHSSNSSIAFVPKICGGQLAKACGGISRSSVQITIAVLQLVQYDIKGEGLHIGGIPDAENIGWTACADSSVALSLG